MTHQQLVSYGITALVIGIVLALRWRRMSRPRPLKLERLWILPAIYAAVTAVMFVGFPPHGWAWAFCLVALVAGAALGWQRGRVMRIAIDPDTHGLNQTASPAAFLLIFAIILARQAARAGGGIEGLDPMALTDMLMAFALGLFTAQRIEMYLRGRRLLAAHSRDAVAGAERFQSTR